MHKHRVLRKYDKVELSTFNVGKDWTTIEVCYGYGSVVVQLWKHFLASLELNEMVDWLMLHA